MMHSLRAHRSWWARIGALVVVLGALVVYNKRRKSVSKGPWPVGGSKEDPPEEGSSYVAAASRGVGD